MLRLSKFADYAVLILSHLAENPNEIMSATTVAEKTNLSVPTVSKILKLLLEAELVKSVRGAEGGYYLAKPAVQITIAAIIAGISGPQAITACCSRLDECFINHSCTMQSNWKKINRLVQAFLEKVTIVDMLTPLKISSFVGHYDK